MADLVLPAKFTQRPTQEARSTPRGLMLTVALWRKLTRNLYAGYRPERHYMRGPGPKWHARNSSPHRC
jgi:hypothetical protein